ncbi:DUF5134 domain-containing protein [Streptomyces sp. WA6-1-16]|uniref:DUF5134 domain-containing protein n=1 Tax=Streptomyces sp. WA6-1-16 TaxID=2879427 RepID=UPI001CE37422|nr:DUF5134 domain-containing protein [Streptomyces sp. WA6-1-16]UCA50728.1 DUF5134 domain-containing protein [Streptomyces sp. WA6-1-16]
MHGGASTGWLLMVLCAVSGAYCLLRTRTGAPQERRTARSEALMGFGMAAMAVPAAVLSPPGWAWAVYAVLFGAAALRALRPALRGGHHLHHLVGSLAMVYMAVAMAPAVTGSGGGGHAGHGAAGAGGTPVLTGVLLVYYALYVLGSAGRLLPGAGATPAGGTVAADRGPGGFGGGTDRRPELTTACRLTMGIGMFAMLLTL